MIVRLVVSDIDVRVILREAALRMQSHIPELAIGFVAEALFDSANLAQWQTASADYAPHRTFRLTSMVRQSPYRVWIIVGSRQLTRFHAFVQPWTDDAQPAPNPTGLWVPMTLAGQDFEGHTLIRATPGGWPL